MKKILVILLFFFLTSQSYASIFSDLVGALFTFTMLPISVFAPDNPTLRKNNPFKKKIWQQQEEQENEIKKIVYASPSSVNEYYFTYSARPPFTVRDGKNGIDGRDGKNGIDGRDGKNGIDGRDGKNGIDGRDGKNGIDGRDGKNGIDGRDGKNGIDGRDGKNGIDGVPIWRVGRRESPILYDLDPAPLPPIANTHTKSTAIALYNPTNTSEDSLAISSSLHKESFFRSNWRQLLTIMCIFVSPIIIKVITATPLPALTPLFFGAAMISNVIQICYGLFSWYFQ